MLNKICLDIRKYEGDKKIKQLKAINILLLVFDNNNDSCSIELRPKGIIVRFRSLLETYGLIIPYYKLKIYKGQAQEYSIYRDHYCIKVAVTEKNIHQYFKKINAQKISVLPTAIDEL